MLKAELICGATVCGAAYVMSRLYTAAYMLSRYVLSPSLCRRLCTETAYVQSPRLCI